ncbi:hypothetical protein [Methanobrevibacter filiformis]|uniref:Uncharacterized protein n=1 Tax=Methanobrevibacter filiformis TaxID=55758 RepID=A0A165ZFW9_9EURY|nr:hypothetical protein [Methanobrevibacter filiformis]KZX10658.1 hypothetical protein MBFIL_16850 [Methanobrevibacter filiformis]
MFLFKRRTSTLLIMFGTVLAFYSFILFGDPVFAIILFVLLLIFLIIPAREIYLEGTGTRLQRLLLFLILILICLIKPFYDASLYTTGFIYWDYFWLYNWFIHNFLFNFTISVVLILFLNATSEISHDTKLYNSKLTGFFGFFNKINNSIIDNLDSEYFNINRNTEKRTNKFINKLKGSYSPIISKYSSLNLFLVICVVFSLIIILNSGISVNYFISILLILISLLVIILIVSAILYTDNTEK